MKIIDISDMKNRKFKSMFLIDKKHIEKAFIVEDMMLVTLYKPNTSMYFSCYDYSFLSTSSSQSTIPYVTSMDYDCSKSIYKHIKELRDEYIDYHNLLNERLKEFKNII